MSQSPDVPVPSEFVSPIQVSQLAGLTQSAALESLIQQNIDLTTRLNINLRRVSDMERIVQSLSSQTQGFGSQKDAFQEEIQVLHKRFQSQESKLLNYRIEKENAEKAYATLVIDHRALKVRLDSEKAQAEMANQRTQKFKSKIHNYIRPLFKSLNADSEMLPLVQEDLRRFKRYRTRIQKFVRPWIRDLKFKLQTFKDRCERLEVKTTELAQRTEELLNHLRTKNDQFDADQKKLVGYHEDRWSELNAKFEKAHADLESLTTRFQNTKLEKEKTEEDNVSLHNRSITAERRLEEIEQRYQSDIENLQASLAKFEIAWTEVSQKLDLTNVQLEAAQRLNSSLTDDLSQERQSNEELKTRIRNLKIQEVTLQSVKNAEPLMDRLLEANPNVPQQILEETPISKLETLFAEIQSGDMGQATADDTNI